MAEFEIRGTVVERGGRTGVQGLHVEAWDRDTRFHDMLGVAITDGAGRFRIRFTDEYFGDFRPDLLPDVFFRVFRDDALILTTQEEPLMNEPGPLITVVLEVEPLVEPEVGSDRVDASTALKALDFVRMSDFRGIRREAGDHVTLAGGLLARMAEGAFRQWDWQPVTTSDVRRSDVVNQDIQTAQARLAERQVAVESVEKYDPQLDRGTVKLLTALPARLDPGERVVLYEENGVVKYYARVSDKSAATIDQVEVERLSGELASVRTNVSQLESLRTEVQTLQSSAAQEREMASADLASVRGELAEIASLKQSLSSMQADLAQRNQTIATLQSELATIRTAQEGIVASDVMQKLNRLETQLNRLNPSG
ncbi:hypothetical protein BH23GEM10_BH23GEM10_00060 [soil metagenome]